MTYKSKSYIATITDLVLRLRVGQSKLNKIMDSQREIIRIDMNAFYYQSHSAIR
jgi:hypothetical protein